MPSDPTNPTHDEIRAAWEQYRGECFIRSGLLPVWVWAAAHEFDFTHAGLLLQGVPGAQVDLGTVAMAITVFDGCHIVPLVHLSVQSLEALQPETDIQLHNQKEALRASQRQAEETLKRLVYTRYGAKIPVGGMLGHQTH